MTGRTFCWHIQYWSVIFHHSPCSQVGARLPINKRCDNRHASLPQCSNEFYSKPGRRRAKPSAQENIARLWSNCHWLKASGSFPFSSRLNPDHSSRLSPHTWIGPVIFWLLEKKKSRSELFETGLWEFRLEISATQLPRKVTIFRGFLWKVK